MTAKLQLPFLLTLASIIVGIAVYAATIRADVDNLKEVQTRDAAQSAEAIQRVENKVDKVLDYLIQSKK